MNCSSWFLTMTCLAYGGLDYDRVPPAPPGAPPGIVQNQGSGYHDHPNPGVGAPGGGIAADAAHGDGCGCGEHPGFFARLLGRLRALFSHSSCGACAESRVAGCQACNAHACASCSNCEQRGPSFRERLASLFDHSCSAGSCAPCSEPAPGMMAKMIPEAVPLSTPYSPIPTPSAPAPSVIQPVSVPAARPAAPTAMEISTHYLDKVANAEDYSWVTGQLFYIHADHGLWVVRYAPVDKEDRYGGSVVLAPVASMTGLREGDLVTVHGEILNQGRGTKYLGGPLYRALEVGLKERARP
jgi:hypothetical protein